MIEGPLGGAAFNNEFGRPNLGGFFRVYEQNVAGVRRGYHKPIMIAGGLGSIGATQTEKIALPAGTLLVQLGGPGMRIGMGGGAASSMAAGSQRGRARLRLGAARQPRDRAPRAGGHQPLLAARRRQPDPRHPRRRRRRPVNAFPELVDGAGRGARFDLRQVPLEESGLAPKEIWCNESQERYVLAIAPESLPLFAALCERERCPFAVVGVATDERAAACSPTPRRTTRPIDMPMEVLLGKPPRMHRDVTRVRAPCGAARPRPASSCEQVAHRRAAPPDGRRASASSSPSATAPSAA